MKSNLLDQMDAIPPCFCRLCARKNFKARGIEEIAKRSGLTLVRVKSLSRLPTWGGVTVAEAVAFSKACDVDLLRPRKKLFYLRRAFLDSGLATLSKGLSRKHVESLIRIRQEYEYQTEKSDIQRRVQKVSTIQSRQPQVR